MSELSRKPDWLVEAPSESKSSEAAAPQVGTDSFIDSIRRRLRSEGATSQPQPVVPGHRLRTAIRSPKVLLSAAAIFMIFAVVMAMQSWPLLSNATADVRSSISAVISKLDASEPSPVADVLESEPVANAGRRRIVGNPAVARVEEPSTTQPDPIPSRAVMPSTRARDLLAPSAVPSLEVDGDAAVVPDERVYSGADVDVEPPKLLSPDIPGLSIRGLPTRGQAIELLVRSDGTVDYVKLRTAQERLLDMMILSRAKMWQFEPAQRDGHSVPYRLVMAWETPDR